MTPHNHSTSSEAKVLKQRGCDDAPLSQAEACYTKRLRSSRVTNKSDDALKTPSRHLRTALKEDVATACNLLGSEPMYKPGQATIEIRPGSRGAPGKTNPDKAGPLRDKVTQNSIEHSPTGKVPHLKRVNSETVLPQEILANSEIIIDRPDEIVVSWPRRLGGL